MVEVWTTPYENQFDMNSSTKKSTHLSWFDIFFFLLKSGTIIEFNILRLQLGGCGINSINDYKQ